MSPQLATQMATDWLALRAAWSEVSAADQAEALAYFLLPENDLMNFDLAQLVTAYEAL